MKKIFLLAVVLTVLVGLVSCTNPFSKIAGQISNPSVFHHFDSVQLDKNKMVGDLEGFLPPPPAADTPHTVSCSDLNGKYNDLKEAFDGTPISTNFTDDKFKNAFFPLDANESAKTNMEGALKDLVRKGFNKGVVVYGIYTEPSTIEYIAIFYKRQS